MHLGGPICALMPVAVPWVAQHAALALQVPYANLQPEGFSPLNFVVFLPAIACVVLLFRWTLAQVFLNLYLPVLLLLPLYFHVKVPGLPPLDFSEAVTVPLGLAMVWRLWRTWKVTPTDVAVVLFILSTGAFHFRAHDTSHGIFNIFIRTFEGLVPYLFGKLLIENEGIRVQTVRRVVVLTAVACVLSVPEYFLGVNPFASVWRHFFPNQALTWETQFRWGFGRVAGPYGQSELAGIILFTGIVFALWAGSAYPWKESVANLGGRMGQRTALLVILVLTLFTTQARGPWLGTMLAVPIALLGRTQKLLRNGLVFAALCLVAGTLVYLHGRTYTSVNPSTDEQQTAQYRAQLIDTYIPIAEQGGAWGWGEGFPVVSTAGSIDNEYLFLWLVQGWVGMVTFVLLGLDTVRRLITAIARSTGKRDRFFALTLLGAFCGVLLTVGTVFLFGQPYQIFFLLAGWAQSVKTARAAREERQLAFAHALT